MTYRLDRIETLILSIATVAAVVAAVLGLSRPIGIALAGGAAWFDFVLIRRLGAAMLAQRPSTALLVPMALAKSLIVVALGAGALLLPPELIDGLSFAIGVSALPLAIVLDAALPIPAAHAYGS
jgi:hypothetical protein